MKPAPSLPPTASAQPAPPARTRFLIVAVALIAVVPLLFRGTSCGQDFDFHLQNWLEVVAHWRHGVLYPHWAESASYLAGEPRFVFYPPLSWITGALLGLIFPWTWTPFVFTLLALLAAGFSFRAMAREWLPESNATLAACLYTVNPYMLFVAYERAAMAELLAAAILPLLVFYALRDKHSFVPLAVTIAALWLTNAPAAVIGCYTLALLVLVAALEVKSPRLIVRAASAVVLGLALAGFWLIPALRQQRWVQIDLALGSLLRVQDSFLFGYVPLSGVSADERFDAIYHNQVLHTVSWIVVALMLAAVLAGVFAFVARRKTTNFLPLIAVGIAAAALQFRFSDPLWRLAPKLQYLQFPWRWMMILALVAAALAGLALPSDPEPRRRRLLLSVLVIAVAGGLAFLASAHLWQPCDEEDNVRAQMAAISASGFAGTDEYTPQNADTSDLPTPLAPITILGAEPNVADPSAGEANPATIVIARCTPERRSALITTTRPAFALFRLMDYPAWRVTRNGAAVEARPHRADGLIVVPLLAGANQIEISWHTTSDEWAGIALSLAALAFTLTFVWKGRRTPDGRGFR